LGPFQSVGLSRYDVTSGGWAGHEAAGISWYSRRRGGKRRLRYSEFERLCGFEVEDQLDFRRLLDRQIGGFLAIEDAAI